jgi:4-amino-4-deoxy-L-arabinose transferase-like glycosyltransferase
MGQIMPTPQVIDKYRNSVSAPDSVHPVVTTSPVLPRGIVLLSLLISLVMIGFVYRDLSPTWDEPAHIGNGIAWLTPPYRLIDPVDPPVGRVSTAIGPWLFGAKAINTTRPWDAGNLVLREGGHYWRTATLARLGILPWYFLAVFLVWSMTRRWLGEWAATLAAVLFIFCPPILANASIATTDMPFVATFLLAVDRIWIALREPKWGNYAWAGFAVGLACSAKMSGVPFSFLCVVIFLAYLWLIERKLAPEQRHGLPRVSAVAFTVLVMALTIWAAYRFQTGSLATATESRAHVVHLADKTGPLRPAVMVLVDHMPAYQFLQGIRVARLFTKRPPLGYLFGQTYTHGRSYFFFLMLMVKTPIPLLILGLAGLWFAMRGLARGSDPFLIVPVAGFFVPMLVATASHVHLGIRHILVVYAFLAMTSALAAQRLLQSQALSKAVKTGALGILIAWNVVACIVATPEFLPWYNEPATPWATLIHVDSDYDWGQGLWQLNKELKVLHVDQMWISYNGALDLDQFGLPPWQTLPNSVPEKGWIVISESNYRVRARDFGWLSAYKPVAMAGKTLRIYHIE